MPDDLLDTPAGTSLLLLGNEAIVRGAVEAGVKLVSGYPGTPASEIGDLFALIHDRAGILFKWSINEKIALEAAFAAAMTGVRSLCFMKHLGLASAGDPLATIPYIGVNGGMVIVSAGDPGMVVSPNEQDQRLLARMNHLPVLEPATPREALAMTRLAFTLSEACQLPVLLRTTPAVAQTRAPVAIGARDVQPRQAVFLKQPARLNPIPANARTMRRELVQRLRRAEQVLADSWLFPRHGSGRHGILAAGPPLAMVLDRVEEQQLLGMITVQAAGATYPLPVVVVDRLLADSTRLLVVEELTPFLEDQLRVRANETGAQVEILGKRTGHLPEPGAYTPEQIAAAIASLTGRTLVTTPVVNAPQLPVRPPALCPGCAHRGAYVAVRTVFGDNTVYYNDIGCYTLGYGPPLGASDTLLAMGSSIAMAAAASRLLEQKTVAFVGDSTFFHSGMPALLDAAETGADLLVVVLDNRTTAMTGHQPSPTTPLPGNTAAAARPSPEGVAQALGITQVAVVDPYDLKETVTALQQTRQQRGVAVVVARRDCVLLHRPALRPALVVDQQRCRHCGHETAGVACGQAPLAENERALIRRRILAQEQGQGARPAAVAATAPCTLGCPVKVCIPGYIGRIAGGRYAEALALVRQQNPLAAVSSVVCHRPCEPACVRHPVAGSTANADDDAIAINDLKRFLVEWEASQPDPPPLMATAPATGNRVAVLGAGPSGLACAHELRRRGHQVVLYDRHERAGGLLEQAIPSHRLPRSLLTREIDWMLGHGIELRCGVELGRDLRVSGLLEQGFAAVYLGLGGGPSQRLGLPGDDLPGVIGALELLQGRQHRLAGRHCLVVGGGDAAIDAARTLVRLGAASVQVVYRRDRDEMPAHREEIDAAETEGVELLTRLAPVQVLGETRVTGLRVVATRPGPIADDGRARPAPVAGEERDLVADLVVAAVGQQVDLSCLDLSPALTEDGLVEVDPETGATSVARVFAGGDLTPGPRTVVHAVADGRRAAAGIDRLLTGDRERPSPIPVLEAAQITPGPAVLAKEPGFRAGQRDPAQRRQDHDEVVVPLTEQQARHEAARCLLCTMCSACSACADLLGCPALHEVNGQMAIDQALCTGCGVCVSLCPNGAIVEQA